MHIAGSAKLSTTTAREQNRALGPQVYGRYPNPGKHRKIISTIAFARLVRIWSSAVVVDSSVLPALSFLNHHPNSVRDCTGSGAPSCHLNLPESLGDWLLSNAGAGRSYPLRMRLPNASPILDKILLPMGPGILSNSRLQFCTG